MPRSPRKIRFFFFALFISIPLFSAQASQDVVYKEARPLKQIGNALTEGDMKNVEGAQGKSTVFLYDPTGKSDPFKPFLAEAEEVGEKKKNKPKTYLETVDLSQLELTAIIVGPKGNWAMVRDSKGTGHVIKRGVLIGTKGGAVHKITDKKVVIREEYRDFKGKTQYKDVDKKVPALE